MNDVLPIISFDLGTGERVALLSGPRAGFTLGSNGQGDIRLLAGDGTVFLVPSNVDVLFFTDGRLSFADALAGADVALLGTNASETLDASGIAGEVQALGGDDTVIAGVGTTRITGGAGVDTADLSQLQNGVVVLMPNNGFVFGIGALRSVSEFENVIGTAFRDEVVSNAGDNVIDTGAGNDVITVSAGQDVLRLGAGDDRLTITTAIEAGTQAFGGDGQDAVSLTSVSQDMDLRGIEITGFEVFQGGFTEVTHTLTAEQAAQFEAFALFEDINLDVVMDGATSFDLSNTVVQSLFDRDTGLGLRIFADAVDQMITGSARAETVVLDGVRADFAISHIYATQVLVSGPGDVLHTLNDIEVLEFDDTSLVIGTPNTAPTFTPPPVDLITASVGGGFHHRPGCIGE